jgi:hypothetical protein
MPLRGYWAIAAGLLAALLLQCVLSMRLLSASFDEHAHLPAGYTYWKTGQIGLNPQHPPLVKLLCAAPLLALKPRVDWTDPGWTSGNEWRFGHIFFYEWGNDVDRLLFWGRMPVVLLSVLLGVYVFLWSSALFGPPGGVASLALYAFCPNVIAHARFVTMDLALAAFMTACLYHLWRYEREGTRRTAVLLGLYLGLSLATKFSALFIAPVVGAVIAWRFLKKPDARPVIVCGLALFVVWAAYLFGDLGLYVKGLRLVNQDHPHGHRYYCLGTFKEDGFWYYFVVAFLLKTPIPALIAIAGSTVLAWRTRAVTARDDLFILVPAALFFVLTSIYADNLGVRYVLPVYPLLFVFAGRVAAWATTRRTRAIVLVLGLWQMGGTLLAYPDYLSYFNEAAGGSARGYRSLDDSNVDWCQDVKRLKGLLDEKHVGFVKTCFHLKGFPPYYGIDGEPMTPDEMVSDPAPGAYAISTHCLAQVRQYNEVAGRELDWLARFKPTGRVGSFYLFEIH